MVVPSAHTIDCLIDPDDGQGHSTFTLVTSPVLVPYCGDLHPLTFVFPKAGSVPTEIYTTNPASIGKSCSSDTRPRRNRRPSRRRKCSR